MTTILKMKDIPINDYNSNIELYNDEYLFEMIVLNYIKYKETNITRFWINKNFIDFEEEDVDDDIENINNMNLSLIKKYVPDIYNTYEYNFEEYENKLEMIFLQNLKVCADILYRRFNHKFYRLINIVEGGELSGDDTDTDE